MTRITSISPPTLIRRRSKRAMRHSSRAGAHRRYRKKLYTPTAAKTTPAPGITRNVPRRGIINQQAFFGHSAGGAGFALGRCRYTRISDELVSCEREPSDLSFAGQSMDDQHLAGVRKMLARRGLTSPPTILRIAPAGGSVKKGAQEVSPTFGFRWAFTTSRCRALDPGRITLFTPFVAFVRRYSEPRPTSSRRPPSDAPLVVVDRKRARRADRASECPRSIA